MYKLKTLCILALAVLAVYQIGQLWFVHITNRSLTMYLSGLFNPSVPDGYEELSQPMRVVFGNGDGRFDMRYGERADTAEDAFAEVLRTGVFNGTRPAPEVRAEILAGPVVLYEYAFALRAEIFERAFGRRNASRLSDNGVEYFHTVAVAPNGVVFFCDARAWVFSAASGVFELPTFPITNALYFVSDGAQFLPRTQWGWRHRPIRVTNPYTNRSDEVRIDSVNAQVGHLFDNPATRNPRMVDNVITISSLNTVVRFLPEHILEFNCFRPIRRGGAPDFVADFSAALAFLRRDPHVPDAIYLAGYELRERTHVFWFNYIIGGAEGGGFPLLVPREGWGSEPLPYPIEVTADHGQIVRYRKLAHRFVPDTTREVVIRQADMHPPEGAERVRFGFGHVAGAGLEVRG